ncbi:hypothetical protein Tco_0047537 [Tanacetum coccineum]
MAAAAVKQMALNFSKLGKFEGMDFRRSKKKMHFLLSSMSVVYVHTTPIPEDGENATMDQIKRRNKWDNDDYVCISLILNGLLYPWTNTSLSWKDFKHTLKHKKKELTLVDLGSYLCIKESLKVQDSDKPKGNNVVGLRVLNMVEHNNSIRTGYGEGRYLDENRFSSVPRPSQRSLINGTEDISGSVVPKEVTEEVVAQPTGMCVE